MYLYKLIKTLFFNNNVGSNYIKIFLNIYNLNKINFNFILANFQI